MGFITHFRYDLYLWYKEYMNARTRQAPESSRVRRQRETRAALLDAAYRTFCDQGYGNASLETIAAEAGFTRGALYSNFANKEDLFLALAAKRADAMFDEWRELLPQQADKHRVDQALGAWLADTIEKRRGWFLASAEFSLIAARNPDIAARRATTMRQAHHELGELLQRFEPHTTADVTELGTLTMALIDGLILHTTVDPHLDTATALATGIRRILNNKTDTETD